MMVQAKSLKAGQRLAHMGVTLTANAQRGLRTPKGKVEIFGVRDNGQRYAGMFNANTQVHITE